jgi:hypothetical protein
MDYLSRLRTSQPVVKFPCSNPDGTVAKFSTIYPLWLLKGRSLQNRKNCPIRPSAGIIW